MTRDSNTLVHGLLRELVAIDSVNPSLVPGARGEADAANYLQGWLEQHGIEAELQETSAPGGPSRPNVLAWLGPQPEFREAKRHAALLMEAHIDTVGAGDMMQPFTPREREGRLYGRGALDIKSGVAAMCAAAVEIEQSGARLRRPLAIAVVVDEECNSAGTEALAREISADAAVVMEPTDLKLCIAHKGYAWYRIVTHGRAAHGSLPQEGRDAIRMMGRVLERLDALDKELAAGAPHRLLGHASLHASLVRGGHELSSYPALCELDMERRTLPGETEAQLEQEVALLLRELSERDADFHATFEKMAARPPYEISEDAAIVKTMHQAIHTVTGAAEFCGMPFWTDTALLAEAGIPGVVFGPRGKGLHGPEEYVEMDSVAACAQVLREAVLAICG